MIEGATITLPLSEFDRLRTDSEDFQRLIRQIAKPVKKKIPIVQSAKYSRNLRRGRKY